MIGAIQVVLIIIALFAWSRAMLRLKKREISPVEFSFWSLVWIALIVMSTLPKYMDELFLYLGISSAVNFIIYLSIAILFYLVFRIFVTIDKQNQELTKLVREIAIQNSKKKK